MLRYLIILFFAFYTEGVFSQENLGAKPDFEAAQDTTAYIQGEEEDLYEADIEKTSPYAAARQQYEQKAIEPQKIDSFKWAEATKGFDYSGDVLKKNKPAKFEGFNPNWSILVEFLKWFFIVGAIILIAFLIARFVGEGNIFSLRTRRLKTPSVLIEGIDLAEVESNLENIALDPLIQKAIADKNYTLAIRLYYLAILKELSLSGAIEWQKDKTNRAYLREMNTHKFEMPFRSVTSIFERVWYSSQGITEVLFQQIEPNFQNLLHRTRIK